MTGNRIRDFVLIAAFVAIAVAALWPDRGGRSADDARAEKGPASGAGGTGRGAIRETPPPPEPVIPASTDAALPLAVGARWVYHVDGPKDRLPGTEWTMEIRSLPAGDRPGEVAVGFGLEREFFPIWSDGGAVRFAGLPFTAPLEFSGTRPSSVGGTLTPSRRGLVEGAAWSQILTREVAHVMATPKGGSEKVTARGVQTDRALAGELADVIVPAGRFSARRVDWTCRLDLMRGKRPILDPLTAKAFRTEIMWIAPGVGVVRRRVEHAFPEKAVFTFDLTSTTIAPPREGGV
jgi:hypothetical protein